MEIPMARKNKRIVDDDQKEDIRDIHITQSQAPIDMDNHCMTDTECHANIGVQLQPNLPTISTMIDMLSLISKRSLPITTLTRMM